MNITIVVGHPDGGSPHFCHALAEAYARGAHAAGHEVRTVDLGRIPVALLRTKDDFEHGAVSPELEAAQAALGWAAHLVLIYPLWLGEMPAVVKAFFEQVLRPGFAFEVGPRGWKPKLRGKSARIIVTMGMPAIFYRMYFGAHGLRSLRRNILHFVGIKPVRATLFGLVENVGAERRAAWLSRVERLGARAR